MRCPFPGMDPYLEQSEIWPDFHDSLITYIREALQPMLRPRYAALTQDRLYVVEHERPIRPDVSVVRTDSNEDAVATAVGVEADRPLVIGLSEEEIREPVIHIIEPAAGNRIVTAIEVLSPDNKTSGAGRESYLRKRNELWQSEAHLAEIDLLRAGQRVLRVSAERLEREPAWCYVVSVSRRPSQCELYAFPIEQRLPRVALPLAHDDPDVVLDLQAAFTRCWEAGPYPELLRYNDAPPGDLSADQIAWCREKGVRNRFPPPRESD
ncbi:MAG: DUF4058 family protein [Pirellulales bacterium]